MAANSILCEGSVFIGCHINVNKKFWSGPQIVNPRFNGTTLQIIEIP